MRSTTTFLLRVVVALMTATSAAFAQTPSAAQLPQQVTIEDVLRVFAQQSARAAADRASIAVAMADRVTAETLPNPTVSYGGVHLFSGLSTGATSQHQFGFDQPLLLFHQRQARLDAADAGVAAEEAHVAQSLASRRLAIRGAFASLVSRQDQLRVLQDALTALERVQELVRGRAAAGDRSQYDVTRVTVETESLRVQTMTAAADVDDAAGQLAVLLGFPGWRPRAVGTLDAGSTSTDAAALWAAASQRRPSIVALRKQQEAARSGLLLARRERLVVPVASGGLLKTQDVAGNSFLFGLSVPLPLFDRNQGAIAKATAQMTAADLDLQASLAEAQAEVESAADNLAKRRAALSAFETSVGQRAASLQQMAEDAYREGSADILELLDANRSLREIQLTRVEQREAVKLAEEQVISAAALDIAEDGTVR